MGAGANLLNPQATEACKVCQYRTGSGWLQGLNLLEYSYGWRDAGIVVVFCDKQLCVGVCVDQAEDEDVEEGGVTFLFRFFKPYSCSIMFSPFIFLCRLFPYLITCTLHDAWTLLSSSTSIRWGLFNTPE